MLIEVWTSAAVAIRGVLAAHTPHLHEALNDWPGPIIALTTATQPPAGDPIALLPRDEILWARPLEPSADVAEAETRIGKEPRLLVMHIGPFQVHATTYVFPGVRWVDFLEAAGGRFVPFTGAGVHWPGGQLESSLVAINTRRLGALITVQETSGRPIQRSPESGLPA